MSSSNRISDLPFHFEMHVEQLSLSLFLSYKKRADTRFIFPYFYVAIQSNISGEFPFSDPRVMLCSLVYGIEIPDFHLQSESILLL